jgi:hypothetical protein
VCLKQIGARLHVGCTIAAMAIVVKWLSRSFASWNPIDRWLRQVVELRRVA